jgi:hypothetical protein
MKLGCMRDYVAGACDDFGRIVILQTPFPQRRRGHRGRRVLESRSLRRLCVLRASAVNPDLKL